MYQNPYNPREQRLNYTLTPETFLDLHQQ